MKYYSTKDAAKKAGISRATIMRWLADGKVRASLNIPLAGGLELHRWTDADIKLLINFRKEKNKGKETA